MRRGAGDEDFDDFAYAAWPRLRWSAFLLTGDSHLAEDLAQTALAKTFASWSRVRRDDAHAYARRVLVNANIDRLRRRRVVEVGDETLAGVADTSPTSRVEDGDELVRLLAGLSSRERRVVVLRYYFDLSEATVADELGVSIGTVKSTASRALAKLRAVPAPHEHTFTKGTA